MAVQRRPSPGLSRFGLTPGAGPMGTTVWSYRCDLVMSVTGVVNRVAVPGNESGEADRQEAELVIKPLANAVEKLMSESRIKMLLTCLALMLLTVSTAGGRNIPGAHDPLAAIEQDYAQGSLTLDEKVMLQLKAIRAPSELPDKYKAVRLAAGVPEAYGGSVTMILKEIRSQWDLLSTSTRRAFMETMARWGTDFVYDSPGGFFKLHYDIDEDSVHAVPTDDSDLSGVPDFVEKCAAYLDTVWARHIDLGYLLPPSDGGLGGDEKYDIYFQNMSYYGYVVYEGNGPMPWNDHFSYMVLHHNFLVFPPNPDPEGCQWGAAKATAAHEYHHAVQFAYDVDEDTWFMELDAVYMEDIVFDHADDNLNYLGAFFSEPYRSLMENSNHYYSCFIWGLYLAQKFDTSLMRAVWEGAINATTVYDALSDTLLARYGWTQDSAFAEFALWNFCTYTRDDGLHHEEAAGYPLAVIGRTHSSFPVNLQNSPGSPAGYGAAYVQFFPGGNVGTLTVTFNGSDSREWAAYLIKSTADNVHEFERIELSPGTCLGAVEVPGFESYYRVALVGINVSEFSAGAPYTYRADVLEPYDVSLVVLTTDSAVYSGGVRQWECQVTNNAPLHDVIDLIVWDDLGWIPPDTIDKALAPGRDTVFSVAVSPPKGTPLEECSNLHFKVQSWSDPLVADSQTVFGKVLLQRGDVDFTGFIDIADLVYLVEYMFTSGPQPIPVLDAADFQCNIGVDIGDLVAMVEYMFEDGPPPPCNPY